MNIFRRLRRRRSPGQGTIEVMLILPVFLLMVFLIMEVGYIAFQTLVTNHAAYECARIGAMHAGQLTNIGQAPNFGRGRSAAQTAIKKMIKSAKISGFKPVKTLADPQTGKDNYDVLVEVENDVQLLFPGSSYILASHRGSLKRVIKVYVRMPVENPAPWTTDAP